MAYYKFDDFKRVYVHTNYRSFASNKGSFGGYAAPLEAMAHRAIQWQEAREAVINKLLSEALGMPSGDLQYIMDFITDWFGEYEGSLKDAWMVPEMGEKYGKITRMLGAKDMEKEAKNIQKVFDKITKGMGDLVQDGGFNKEGVQQVINNLKAITEGLNIPIKGSGLEQVVRGSVLNLKGLVYEFVMGQVIHAALASITRDSKNFQVKHVAGSSRGADIAVELENMTFGFNIKSTALKTFEEHGLYLFHGTVESIANVMAEFTGSSDAIEAFKYYIVNISRMKAKSLTGQEGGGSLKQFEEGYQLMRSLLKTYATVFIGEDSPELPQEYRQADVFILHGRVFLKSQILKHIVETKDISALLQIGYTDGGQDWSEFDNLKRSIMFDTLGKYDAVSSKYGMSALDLGSSAAKGFLNQSAVIKLKLLAGAK